MYKKVFLATLVGLTTVAVATAPGRCDELEWGRDLQKSLYKAKTENKMVLADVYTDWCGPCKMLEKTTFKNPDMIKFLNANFIMVKANAEDGGFGQQIADNNDVHAYPCGLVFNADGKVIKRLVGYRDARTYEKELKQVLK